MFNVLTSIGKFDTVKQLNIKQSNIGILDERYQVNIDKLILIYIVNNILFVKYAEINKSYTENIILKGIQI